MFEVLTHEKLTCDTRRLSPEEVDELVDKLAGLLLQVRYDKLPYELRVAFSQIYRNGVVSGPLKLRDALRAVPELREHIKKQTVAARWSESTTTETPLRGGRRRRQQRGADLSNIRGEVPAHAGVITEEGSAAIRAHRARMAAEEKTAGVRNRSGRTGSRGEHRRLKGGGK